VRLGIVKGLTTVLAKTFGLKNFFSNFKSFLISSF